VAADLQADELGNEIEILGNDIPAALRERRSLAHAVLYEQRARTRIVVNVDGDEVHAMFRKKLFRAQAVASAGFGKEYVFVGSLLHILFIERRRAISGRRVVTSQP
jgi:hypothetical protein